MSNDVLRGGDSAEQALIGAIVVNPSCYAEAAQVVKPSDFRNGWMAVLWRTIGDMQVTGQNVDYVTLLARLEADGNLNVVGGPSEITRLMADTPSSWNYMDYARIVKQWSFRRKAIDRASQMARTAASGDVQPDEIVDLAAQIAADFSGHESSKGPTSFGDVAAATYDRAGELQDSGKELGVKSRLPTIDAAFNGGFQPGELYLIAARPGVGKSVFTLQTAVAAAEAGKRVLYWSGEMSKSLVFARAASAWIYRKTGTMVNAANLRNGKLDDWTPFADAIEWASALPLLIDDTPAVTVGYLRRVALAAKAMGGLDYLVVDYLGLLTGKGDNRNAEVGSISVALKSLASELDIPILAAQQMSRAVEIRGADTRPQLSDLRDSGSLEQDADVVMFLHTKPDQKERDPREIQLYCEKNRNGAVFSCGLLFWPGRMTLGEMAPDK